jgi:hypothetical protein
MKRAWYVILFFAIVGMVGHTVLGELIPETYIYLGRQTPKKYVKEIKELDLIDENERLQYFYTIGFLDIKDGFYFLTDSKLVAYCQDWEEPKTVIDLPDITILDIKYNDALFEDSWVYLETNDGLWLEFPLSNEKDRDEKFYEFILKRSSVSNTNETDVEMQEDMKVEN